MATAEVSRKKNTSKRSTGGKSTGNKSKQNNKKSSFQKNKAKQTGIAREAGVLITTALSVIFFIANFGVGGVVGSAISSFFFGLFGIIAYIFPILLFLGIIFAISNKNNSVARIKLIAAVCVMIFLCAFIQLAAGNHAKEWGYGEYYRQSSIHKNGGGFFGGLICKTFANWFGVAGAFIIDIVLMIIGAIVITGRSFLAGLRKGSRKVVNTTKRDVEEYRIDVEVKKRKRRDAKLVRAENKAYGVTYDTEIRPEDEDSTISELSLDIADKKKKREPEKLHIEEVEDKDNEFFMFEPAKKKAKTVDEEIFSFNVKDFGQNIGYTEPELKHYEEEQSSAFDAIDGETETIFDNAVGEEPAMDIIDSVLVGASEADMDVHEAGSDVPEADIDMVEDFAPEQIYEEFVPVKEQAEFEKKTEPSKDVAKTASKPKPKPKKNYVFPPKNLLKQGGSGSGGQDRKTLEETARKLMTTLASFGVKVEVKSVSEGPTVTRYEVQPEIGVKVSKIVSLADDIKLALAAADIRIEAPIPGKSLVGIEVPNKDKSGVLFGDLVASKEFRDSKSIISFAAGKDISGQVVMSDIGKMPHLLIAGATGSGKSVCINTIIMSILYKAKPDEVKLIMVDPKVVELGMYNGIPHLITPVVTDPKKAAAALNWAVGEMDRRYKLFAEAMVRDLKGYNDKVEKVSDNDYPEGVAKPVKLPYIVIIIDELADLMMVSSKEVEASIVRLTQLARACGIHLVIATQRPSVNVITGLIKANVPSRIALSVSSGVDSRTIIDMNGAEKLLGRGDMLYYPAGFPKPARVQGAYISDEEASDVVEFIKEHSGDVEYDSDFENSVNSGQAMTTGAGNAGSGDSGVDEFFSQAGYFIIEKQRASIGNLQRMYKIGFNRAARIMDQLCDAGVVGPEEGTKPRKVLMTEEEFTEYLNSK